MKTHRREGWVKGLVICAAVLALLGPIATSICIPQAAAAEPVTIRYIDWMLTNEPENTAVRRVIEGFEKENPGIKVQFDPTPYDQYVTKIFVQMKAGQAPDVIKMSETILAGWIGEGTLRKLDSFIADAGGDRFTGQFYKSINDLARRGNSQYGIPVGGGGYMLQYNTRLYQEAGLDPNRPPKDFKEFLAYAGKLTKKDSSGTPIQWAFGMHGRNMQPNVGRFANWVWAFGGDILNSDNSQSVFDSPQTIEALTFWSELYNKYGYAPPGTLQAGPGDVRSLFAQRKTAMVLSILWGIDMTLFENPSLKPEIAFAPFPRLNPKYPVGMQAFYTGISTSSKHPEAAWKLAEYFGRKDSQKTIYMLSHHTPARVDAFRELVDQKVDPYAAVAEQVSRMPLFPLPPIPQWAKISDVIGRMMGETLMKLKSPAEAAKEGHSQINKILGK